MFRAIARDLRFAARGLRRSPGFTAAAILTLALGIAATAVVFSVVYGVIFRPLPFPNADRLVQVVQLLPLRPGQTERTRVGLSLDQIAEWRATSRTLAGIGYYGSMPGVLTGGSTPVRLSGASVSVPLFRALGVGPLRGRLFTDEEELPGNEQVVILSYQVWATRFGASEDVVEQSIVLNGRPYRIIGVMPDGFGFPSVASPTMSVNSVDELSAAPEFWTPIVARARPAGPVARGGGMTLARWTLALLRPDVRLEQATAEANTLMPARAEERYPIELVSPRVEEARTVRPVLLLFQGAVLFVLFIACINVINLLLARAADRRRELAVRLALGASRSQLASHAMAEGLLIGLGGGALGCLLAYQTVALFRMLPPYLLPRMADIRVDTVVLATVSGVSVAAGLCVGLAAAVRTLRADVVDRWIPWTSRSINVTRRPSRALVVVETAAGIILLAGAGLLLASFVRLTNVDRGFQTDELFTFGVALPQERYLRNVAQYAFHDEFAATLRQLPGVSAVAASRVLGPYGFGVTLEIEGEPVDADVGYNVMTPGVFETFGIPLRGRDFTVSDRTEQPTVAIVNETLARRFFPGENPLGRRIRFQDWSALEIVGVAGDTRMRGLDTSIAPEIYLPQDLDGPVFGNAIYVVRASNADVLPNAIRTAAARLERDAVVFDAMPMETLLARHVTTPKVYGVTAASFAAVAVTLAALGLYGVLAYSIGTRTREFGIRIALGAATRVVVARVIREAFAMVASGIAIGIGGAVYLSRFLETMLFGIQPHDPTTFATVAVLFLVVAAVACYIPARRATRVDPVVALRAE